MTKFYICTKEIAQGPYLLDEIDKLNINSDDLIWSYEYGQNRKAIQIPEFKAYFKKRKKDGLITKQVNKQPLLQNIVLVLLLSVLIGLVVFYFTAF